MIAPLKPATTSEVIWQGDEISEQQHRGPAEDFAAAIRENRQPRTSLENALLMQTLFDAIYQAADTGQCVENNVRSRRNAV